MIEKVIHKMAHARGAGHAKYGENFVGPIYDMDALPEFTDVFLVVEALERERDPSFVYIYAIGRFDDRKVAWTGPEFVVLANLEFRMAQDWSTKVSDLLNAFKTRFVVADAKTGMALRLQGIGPIMTPDTFLQGPMNWRAY